jgi:hypothetical protein
MMLSTSRMKIRPSFVRRQSQRYRTDWSVRGGPDKSQSDLPPKNRTRFQDSVS